MDKKLLFLLLLVPALIVVGCSGDDGDEGAMGPPGMGYYEYTYIGTSGLACYHCHSDVVNSVALTGHAEAYDDLAEEAKGNAYCVQCHTTGWDSDVDYDGETATIAVVGPNPHGYDDYFNQDGDLAAERRSDLEGVQCEACHGPMGQDISQHVPRISFASRFEDGESLSLCSPCHEGQLEEWVDSGHGNVAEADIQAFNDEHYVGNPACAMCHYSEGFIMANDPKLADMTFPSDYLYSFIGCVTCHDPHVGPAGEGNEAQLRNVGAVEVEYHPGFEDGDEEVARMEGYGTAQVCGQCHHARRDTDNVTGQIADGYAHFGPHGSPQMDMFLGAGCYEIAGYTYDGEFGHQNIENACVKCHMVRQTELHGSLQDHSFHTFEPGVGNCEPCHTVTDFNVNDVQTTVMGLMDDLAVALGFIDADDMAANFDSEGVGVQVWEREAAYAFFFVLNDGSYGVHNTDYTEDLLNNAIAWALDKK